MAIKPISQTAPPRADAVFGYGERRDVADAASGEIAGTGVMNCMIVPPSRVWRQSDDAEDAPHGVVDPTGAKIGTVAAIMLDDEKAHEEERRWYGAEKRGPEALRQAPEQTRGAREQWHDSSEELADCAAGIGLRIAGEALTPVLRRE